MITKYKWKSKAEALECYILTLAMSHDKPVFYNDLRPIVIDMVNIYYMIFN